MASSNSSVTPGRTSYCIVDISDPVLTDEAITRVRDSKEISVDIQGHLSDDFRASNVKYWSTGCWTLKPIQEEITNIHEYIDVLQLNLDDTHFHLITLLSTVAMIDGVNAWRQSSDLPGMAYNNSVISASGDKFLIKKIPATSSNVGGVPPSSGIPQPSGISTDIPLDRCGEGTDIFPADQPFFLRWTLPGTGQHYPNYVWSFYFGQYCCTIKGQGQAVLWEYCHDSNNTLQWRKRDTFRYCRPSQISDASHTLLIFPHVGINGERLITFQGGEPDSGGFLAGITQFDPETQIAPTAHTYQVNVATRAGDQDESPGHATKSGIIRFDMRRDLIKLKLQISKLGFATSGYLRDLPQVGLPYYALSYAQPVNATLTADIPATCTLTGTIEDSDTNTTYNPSSSININPRFDFTGDGYSTPKLWGYTMERPQTVSRGTATPLTTAVPSEVSLSGYAGDPAEQTGHIVIDDAAGAATRIRDRGQLACMVGTYFTPPGGSLTNVRLERGYIYRPGGTLKGKTGKTWPSPNWNKYSCPIVGMWWRLEKRIDSGLFKLYTSDPTATAIPPFVKPTWRVTDIVIDLIKRAGFPDTMISIPTIEVRMWYGSGSHSNEPYIKPGISYGEFAKKLLSDMLGAYLYFDETAGTEGQWIIIFGNNFTAKTPVYNFVTAPNNGSRSVYTPPHAASAYLANTTFMQDGIVSKPVPPEFNSVYVYCPVTIPNGKDVVVVRNYMANPLSFNVPGFTTRPDPTHPDYINGSEFRLNVVDLGCVARSDAGGFNITDTQRNVDFKVRRLYDFTCHGLKTLVFDAPLVFVQDLVTGNWRKLRYFDQVTVDTIPVLIRSCSPNWINDGMQMATYETTQTFTCSP